ncbi:hypothetical protein G9A89_008467 [Geosiphon pyriformis]|nr:hypothetical protein G9A89_008467 [Geosiphon pyriformis]
MKFLYHETKHPQWENDDRLAIADADQIRAEYEEMVVQFGFISLFAPAFPLAPLFAWINNLSEIRGDAFKYIQTRKRPVGLLAQNIGMWNNILNFISFLSVLTNATILAFHSTYVNDLFHKYVGDSDKELLNARLVFILIFENFIFLIKITLGYFIPDIPKSVSNAFKREKYLERVDLEGDIIAADDFPEEEEIKDDSQVNKEALGEFKKAIEKLKSCTVVPGRWRDS